MAKKKDDPKKAAKAAKKRVKKAAPKPEERIGPAVEGPRSYELKKHELLECLAYVQQWLEVVKKAVENAEVETYRVEIPTMLMSPVRRLADDSRC